MQARSLGSLRIDNFFHYDDVGTAERAPLRMCKRVLGKIERHLAASDDGKQCYIHIHFIWSRRLKNTGSCWLMWPALLVYNIYKGAGTAQW